MAEEKKNLNNSLTGKHILHNVAWSSDIIHIKIKYFACLWESKKAVHITSVEVAW